MILHDFTKCLSSLLGNPATRYSPPEYPYSIPYLKQVYTPGGMWTLGEDQRPGSSSPNSPDICSSSPQLGVPPLSHQPVMATYTLSPGYGGPQMPMYSSTSPAPHCTNYSPSETKPYGVWPQSDGGYPYH